MNESPNPYEPKALQAATSTAIRWTSRWLQSLVFSALAALFGLICACTVGVLWWPPGAGITLIGIGLVSAGVLAKMLAVRWNRPASVVASGVGAMVACFMAASVAEVVPAGSIEWMWKGGLYGACVGLPIALLLAPLGLIENSQ